MVENNEPSGYDKDLKRSWVDQFYEEINQVQQRFNFFLIATSFLFLAFITMITSRFPYIGQMGDVIIHITAFFGIAFSFYFFQINYHQARVADEVSEKKLTRPLLPKERKTRIKEGIRDAFCYLCKAKEFATARAVSYTWYIPFMFCVLWFIVWLIWFIGRYIN